MSNSRLNLRLRYFFDWSVCINCLILRTSLSHEVENVIDWAMLIKSPLLVILRLHQSFIGRILEFLWNQLYFWRTFLNELFLVLDFRSLSLHKRMVFHWRRFVIVWVWIFRNFFELICLCSKNWALIKVPLRLKIGGGLRWLNELQKLLSVVPCKLVSLKF